MSPKPPTDLRLDEAAARQALLVRACEAPGVPASLWSPEDRAWASRLAQQTAPADAAPAAYLAERTRHALQRLLPRDPALGRWLGQRGWRTTWLLLALAGGLLAGLLADSLAGGQRIDVLAPAVWAVIAWNLVVMLGLLVQGLRGGSAEGTLRRWTARALSSAPAASPVLKAASTAWAPHGAALWTARAAALLHAAAAALALGLIAGLYLRGLVFDIRAGWQSTFLEPATVQALLQALLAPASALTGIPVPDTAGIEALRLVPGSPASASAAPWIHLHAAQLALLVVLPRTLLCLAALWRARRSAAHIVLPAGDPYFQRLLLERHGAEARVQVLPHAAAPSPQATLGLRAVLAAGFGEALQLRMVAVTPFGEEEAAARLLPEPGTTLRVALFDLGATPEAESQGRFVQALQAAAPALPLLLVVDEAAFQRRFGALAERLAGRRAAWQRLGDALGCGVVCVDLDQPDAEAAGRALHSALNR